MSLSAESEREIILNYVQDTLASMRHSLDKRHMPEIGDRCGAEIQYGYDCMDLKVLADALMRNIYRSFDPMI